MSHVHRCSECRRGYSCECPDASAMYGLCQRCEMEGLRPPPTLQQRIDALHAHALGVVWP